MNKRKLGRYISLEERLTPAVPSSFAAKGAGGGGALFSPSISRLNVNDMTIASDMSNIFRSGDSGASWATINHAEIQGNHFAKVVFSSNPNILYSIDYTVVDGADLATPTKSTDGGTTWTPLAGDPTAGEAFFVAVDPTNPNRVLVGDYLTLYVSTDGGANFTPKYTTTNSGAGLHIGGAFFDGANIYVGTNAGLLTSSNSGGNFAVSAIGGIAGSQAIVSFSGAGTGASVRLFAVTLGSGDVYAGITGADFGGYAGVYTWDAGQPNWVLRTTGITGGNYPFFVASSETDPNVAYVGGGSDAGEPIVFKTSNGGTSWTSVLLTSNNKNVATGWSGQGGDRGWGYGEYVLGMAVAPTDPGRVLITDLGFGHLTVDGGTSWKATYVNPADLNAANTSITQGKAYRSSGLDNTTSWSLAWADANTILLGNSDVKGQRSTNAGTSWAISTQPDNSMYRVIKHANGKMYAATSTVHDMYQSTYLTDTQIDGGDGAVRMSKDNGATWEMMHDFNNPVVWVASDPSATNRLYAAVADSTQGGIYVSNDILNGAASTWTKLATPPRTQGHAFNIVVLNDGDLVVSYSGRRASNAFTLSSGVFLSEDGGATWADRSDAGMKYWTKDIVVDPHDANQNTWYAGVFSGYGGVGGGPPNGTGSLYKSTNRGLGWTRINALDRVTSITIHPTKPNEAYLTTEVNGLWHTDNLNAVTPTFSLVADYPFRQPERVFFNPFNVNEVWVTAFGGGLKMGLEAVNPPPSVSGVQVNNGSAQRSQVTSLSVTFSTVVSITPNSFTINGPGGAVSYSMSVSSTATNTTALLTFAALTDGNYTLGLPVNAVTDGVNNLTSPLNFAFHRLFGDGSGDGKVDSSDFILFRNAFNTSSGNPLYNAAFDSNGDNKIDSSDFIAFRQRFNTFV